MNILHLTLKKKWFDMAAMKIKLEEYRDIKPYWYERLMHYDIVSRNNDTPANKYTDFKHYDIVRFKNGYSKGCPEMDVKVKGIGWGTGNPEWGAIQGRTYFVIELGEIISIKNWKQPK